MDDVIAAAGVPITSPQLPTLVAQWIEQLRNLSPTPSVNWPGCEQSTFGRGSGGFQLPFASGDSAVRRLGAIWVSDAMLLLTDLGVDPNGTCVPPGRVPTAGPRSAPGR